MYSKILLVYILLVLDSINSTSIFDEDSSREDLRDVIPDHLKSYNYNLICKLQPNGYNCDENEPMRAKFYFDIAMKTCMTFWYGHCGFSHNKFNTLDECNGNCFDSVQEESRAIQNITDNLVCRLQPEIGNCKEYLPMFYFDITTLECRGFSYSGCGGNNNKFLTANKCLSFCTQAVSDPKRTSKDRPEHDHQWDIEGRRHLLS